MAVPDTDTFTLIDVTTEIGKGGTNLAQSFDQATGTFDPLYVGDKTNLLNFRNYVQTVIYYTTTFDDPVGWVLQSGAGIDAGVLSMPIETGAINPTSTAAIPIGTTIKITVYPAPEDLGNIGNFECNGLSDLLDEPMDPAGQVLTGVTLDQSGFAFNVGVKGSIGRHITGVQVETG